MSASQAILRICWLRNAGYTFAKMEGINLWYDAGRRIFYGPQQSDTKDDEKLAQEKMVSTHWVSR